MISKTDFPETKVSNPSALPEAELAEAELGHPESLEYKFIESSESAKLTGSDLAKDAPLPPAESLVAKVFGPDVLISEPIAPFYSHVILSPSEMSRVEKRLPPNLIGLELEADGRHLPGNELLENKQLAGELLTPIQIAAPIQIAPIEPAGPPPLFFLSVSYHSAALLSDLIHSLVANPGTQEGDVAGMVIVNNAATDQSVHGFSEQTLGDAPITVLEAPLNMGFGAGCNVGLRWIYERSPQALVWIIHPDAKLFPDAVDSIRQCFFDRPDIAILGTPTLDAEGNLQCGAGQFNRWTGGLSVRQNTGQDILGRPMPARWVSDESMVLNLSTLGHCPQFDEVYFLHYEDCDLCERYYHQGQVISLAPRPLVMHNATRGAGGRTGAKSEGRSGRYTRTKFVYGTFSRLVFLRHHGTSLALGLNIAGVLLQILFGWGDRAAAYDRWKGLKLFFQVPPTPPLETPSFGDEGTH